jgi:hypothetical protein
MAEPLGPLLPFVAGGAFLPTWTVYVILLLGTARPLANALAFIGGNAVFRMGLGLLVIYALDTMPGFSQTSPTPSQGQAIGYGLASLATLALAVVALRRPDDPERPQPMWMQRFERMNPALSFGLGFAAVASPGIQWAYFLGGVNEILRANMTPPLELAVLALFVVALQSMLLVPIVVFAARRESAASTLASMKRWINGHTNRAAGVILLLVTAYLASRAWVGLM